uniref:Uncharacterized protein n=1 Tax=Raphanus sativus TaxID=3726 RepID=A0A650GAE6_RAPSA|nr:hypothetical protein [Raphanus sativus]QGW48620.1 hypothetical protein [Raphanus sativus]
MPCGSRSSCFFSASCSFSSFVIGMIVLPVYELTKPTANAISLAMALSSGWDPVWFEFIAFYGIPCGLMVGYGKS